MTTSTTSTMSPTDPKLNGPKLNQFIADYIGALDTEKGYSANTITNYAHYLERFAGVAAAESLSDVTLEDIDAFRQHLVSLGIKRVTQAGHLTAVRSMLRYAAQRGLTVMNTDVIALPKHSTPIAIFLEPREVLALLAQPDTSSPVGLRDKAILEMLFATGLRVHELAVLNRSDIDLAGGQFNILGKGQKLRTIFLTERAITWISKYLVSRADNYAPLFINLSTSAVDGERLTVRSIQRLVGRHAKAAKLAKHVTPHSLRHSYATNLLNNGCDVRLVQELLGHASIATTQIYTHLTSPQLKAAHTKYQTLDQTLE